MVAWEGMLDNDCCMGGGMLDNDWLHGGEACWTMTGCMGGRGCSSWKIFNRHGEEVDPLLTYGPAAPPEDEEKALGCRHSLAQGTSLCSHGS